MTKIVKLINSLPNLLTLKPATAKEITEAEIRLGVGFAEDYKEYLATFGAIMAEGIELSGIAKSEHRNVVSLTKKERELNSKVPYNMYVIENTGVDGIIIWQDTNGTVYQTQPNIAPRPIAASLADYIEKQLKSK